MPPTIEEIVEILQAPTPKSEISYMGKSVKENADGSYTALAIAYVDARFTQNRLDAAVGPFGWQTEAQKVSGLLIVAISIQHPTTKEWITKYDTGQDDPDGTAKEGGGGRGLFSISFKRAGYQWGIARDIYTLPRPRLKCWAYKNAGGNLIVSSWIEQPGGGTSRSEASTETGRAPRATGPGYQDYFELARTKLDLDQETALATMKNFTDPNTGEKKYLEAIIELEKNLPAEERKWTNAQSSSDSD